MLRLDRTSWFKPAFSLVAVVTAIRLILLAINYTDFFVVEAQYWLWAHHLAFGYFSKPPLIAGLIRAVTWAAQSDHIFWICMPGSVLHAATALILGVVANRILVRQTAIWASAI